MVYFILQIQSTSEAISGAEVCAFALGERMAKGHLVGGKSRNVTVLRDRKYEEVSWQIWS